MATQRSPKPRARGQVCGVFWFGSQVFGAARQQEAVSLQVSCRILLPFFLLGLEAGGTKAAVLCDRCRQALVSRRGATW